MRHESFSPEVSKLSKEAIETIITYAEAVISGVEDSIENSSKLLAHPIDNFVIPISQLVNDSILVIMDYADSHFRNPDVESEIQKNAREAWQNMNNRCQMVKDEFEKIKNASGPERAKIISSLAVSAYIPLSKIKSAKSLVRLRHIEKSEAEHLKVEILDEAVHEFGEEHLHSAKSLSKESTTKKNLSSTNTPTVFTEAINRQKKISDRAIETQRKTTELLESKKNSYFELTKLEREQIKITADTLLDFHNATNQLATLAIRLGGHERTWLSAVECTKGMESMSSNLTKLAYSKDLVSLTNFTSTLGIINAGFTIANGLFGTRKNSSSGMGAIMAAFNILLESIFRVHQEIVQVKKILIQNMEAVFINLNKINNKLDRLEKIISGSFKELHFTDCINDIDKIKKDISLEMVLSETERKDCLTRLSTWIEHHLFSSIQTSLLRDSGDLSKCIEILSNSDFDTTTMLPFLIAQLKKFIPASILDVDSMIPNLSNLELNHSLCDVYATAITAYEISGNNYEPSLMRMSEKLHRAENAILAIRDSKKMWDLLIKKYDKARFDVGRLIKKVYDEIPSNADSQKSFGTLIPNSAIKELFLDSLNHMEFIRIILIKLIELTAVDNDKLKLEIARLETKKQYIPNQ